MKIFKLLVFILFSFFINVSSVPTLIWKGEHPKNKKNILVIGDIHYDNFPDEISSYYSIVDREKYAPKLVEFINSLVLKKKDVNFLVELETEHEFDLRFNIEVNKFNIFDYQENSNSRGSLAVVAFLASFIAEIESLKFTKADERLLISKLFYSNLRDCIFFDSFSFRYENVLNKVTLTKFIKEIRKTKDQIVKELNAFEINEGGQKYIQNMIQLFDDKLKKFELNQFTQTFFKYFPDGKDRLGVFIRIIDLIKNPKKMENLTTNETDKLILTCLKEQNVKPEDFFNEMSKMVSELIKLEHYLCVSNISKLSDLGFIKHSLKALNKDKNVIVFCGKAHAIELILFFVSQGYLHRFQVGSIDKIQSTGKKPHKFIPVKTLENIFSDYINEKRNVYSSFMYAEPFPISFKEIELSKYQKSLVTSCLGSFSTPVSPDLAKIFVLTELKNEILKLSAIKRIMLDDVEFFHQMYSDINSLFSGLTLLHLVILLFNPDTETELALQICKKLLELKVNPYIKIEDNSETRIFCPEFIGCDSFQIAAKIHPLISEELNKFKKLKEEVKSTASPTTTYSMPKSLISLSPTPTKIEDTKSESKTEMDSSRGEIVRVTPLVQFSKLVEKPSVKEIIKESYCIVS